MDEGIVERIAERYSHDAEAYEELWAPELLPLARRLIGLLPAEGVRRVLDLGAGVGALVPELTARFPAAKFVAGDRAAGMIARAPREASRLVLDARRLPFADGSFNVVVLAFMLFHVPGPVAALREVRRVLRPGGAVGLATWGDQRSREAILAWTEELDAHGAEELPAMADHEAMDTPEKVAGLLAAAGLVDPRTEVARSEHPVSLEEFLALRTRIGPSANRLRTLDEEARAACIRSATARIATMDPREYVDDVDALFTVARAPSA